MSRPVPTRPDPYFIYRYICYRIRYQPALIQCRCALARLRARLRPRPSPPSPCLPARLASPRLPARLASPPCSLLPPSRLPSSPVSLPCLRSPAVSRLPSQLRLLLPLLFSPPISISRLFSPRASASISRLRLCFFLVGEAAVEIQLRRSLLSSCRDPSPPVGAHLSHHIPSSPSPALVHICLRLYFFPMGIPACKFGFRRRHLLAGDEIWYSSSSIYTHRLPLLLLLLSSVFFISHCRYSSSSIYTHIFEGGRVGGVGVEGGHELAAAVDGVVFEACSVKGFRGWQGRWRVVLVVVALERAVEE